MNPSPSRLVSAVQPPEVTEGRVARQWATIEQRLPRRLDGRRMPRYVGFGILPLTAAGIVWLALRASSVPSAGAVIESARTPVTVTLRDGSTLALDAQTKLHLMRDEDQAVDVDLGSGKASFDVTHVRGRTFRVHAGLVVVRVVGTRFEVARTTRSEGSYVQVAVARGVVEVQRRDGTGGVRRLNAGETWSALIPQGAIAKPPVAPPPQPMAAEPASDASDAMASTPTTLSARDAFERSALSHVLSGPSPATGKATRSSARERQDRTGPSPAALLKRASLARRSGQMREAAEAYTELLRLFPDDSRAGLAAFELGRVRMDALMQPKAALDAFGAALRSSPRASFREDAVARIVVAFDQLGDRESCRLARDRYQKEFPGGVHGLALASRCSAPAR